MELEWQTRKHRIDRLLTSQGWQLMPWIDGLTVASLSGVAVAEFPTTNGPADYALFVDGQILGIIEAKKVWERLCSPECKNIDRQSKAKTVVD